MANIRKELNYHIHDPNPPALTAEAVMRVLAEVNLPKMQRILQGKLTAAEHAKQADTVYASSQSTAAPQRQNKKPLPAAP